MKRNIKTFLLVSAVGIVMLGVLVFWRLSAVMGEKSEKTLSEVSQIYMSGINEQLQRKFEAIIESRMMQLNGTVNRIEEETFANREELWEELVLCAKIREFSFLALYKTDGSNNVIYGDTITLDNEDEFLGMLDQKEIKVSSGTHADGEKLFLLAMEAQYPMLDGSESDMLVVGISMDFLKDMLQLDLEDDVLTSHIIDSDSTFIVRSSEAFRDSYFERIQESFETHKGKTPKQYEQELKKAMDAHTTYNSCAVINGEHQYIYCSGIENTNWYLVSIMNYETFDNAVSEMGFARMFSILIAGGVGVQSVGTD